MKSFEVPRPKGTSSDPLPAKPRPRESDINTKKDSARKDRINPFCSEKELRILRGQPVGSPRSISTSALLRQMKRFRRSKSLNFIAPWVIYFSTRREDLLRDKERRRRRKSVTAESSKGKKLFVEGNGENRTSEKKRGRTGSNSPRHSPRHSPRTNGETFSIESDDDPFILLMKNNPLFLKVRTLRVSCSLINVLSHFANQELLSPDLKFASMICGAVPSNDEELNEIYPSLVHIFEANGTGLQLLRWAIKSEVASSSTLRWDPIYCLTDCFLSS